MILLGISVIMTVILTGLIGSFAGFAACSRISSKENKLLLKFIGAYMLTSCFNWLNLLFSLEFTKYLFITNTIWCCSLLINPVLLFRITVLITRDIKKMPRDLLFYILPSISLVTIFFIMLVNVPEGNNISFMLENRVLALHISFTGTIYMVGNLFLIVKTTSGNNWRNKIKNIIKVIMPHKIGFTHINEPGKILCSSLAVPIVYISLILLIIPPMWFTLFPDSILAGIFTQGMSFAVAFANLLLTVKAISTVLEEENSKREEIILPEIVVIPVSNDCAELPADTPSLRKREFNSWMKAHKLFLDPDIKLELIASSYGVPARELSLFLNREYHMNFRTYINHLRIVELKRLREKNRNIPLAELILKAGFGSMVSYRRAAASEKKPVKSRDLSNTNE